MRYVTAFFLLLLPPTLVNCQVTLPEATLTVRVVGEDNASIAGATVGVGFELPYQVNQAYRATSREAITGDSGSVTFTEKTSGQVSYGAAKHGYYRTVGDAVNFSPQLLAREPLIAERKVILRKIGTPVPMYARQVRAEIPVIDTPIGFDLVISDWVAPYGNGTTADLIFAVKRKWVDKKDFEGRLVVTFSNPGDGIQSVEQSLLYGSELKLPRTAPQEGYEPQFVTSISRVPGKPIQNEARDNRSHLYRVRTVLDEKGRIVSALYGKLRADIRLDPLNSKTAAISFTYYLNPDGSTNLEFDPNKNLLTKLSPLERVIDP
jgi:hypothetical protein